MPVINGVIPSRLKQRTAQERRERKTKYSFSSFSLCCKSHLVSLPPPDLSPSPAPCWTAWCCPWPRRWRSGGRWRRTSTRSTARSTRSSGRSSRRRLTTSTGQNLLPHCPFILSLDTLLLPSLPAQAGEETQQEEYQGTASL